MENFKLNIYTVLLLMVAVPQIVSIAILAPILLFDSSKQLQDVTNNYMVSMVEEAGSNFDYYIEEAGVEYAFSEEIIKEEEELATITGADSSYMYIVDGHTSEMLYHPSADKIGKPVENDAVKSLVENISKGVYVTSGCIEYKYKGTLKYAAYHIGPNGDYILIITADESDVLGNIHSLTVVTIIVSLVLISIMLGIALVVAKKVASPIKNLSYVTAELASGNLAVDVNAESHIVEIITLIGAAHNLKDELSEIVSSISSNTYSLNSNMSVINDAVQACEDTSSNIVTAITEVSNGAMSMADSVQNTMHATEVIGNDIEEINKLSQEASVNAEEVNHISNEAQDNLTKLLNANKSTITVSEEVVKGIDASSTAVINISKAAQVITDIASQTNLLSLNASIEAARAGDAGRGFAVVAGEISNLAAQSNNSAKEIQQIIDNIIEVSEHNKELAGKIQDSVSSEGDILNKVNESFSKVSDCIKSTSVKIEAITVKADSLYSSKSSILSDISDLSAISEENAASCQETTASIEELSASVKEISSQVTNTQEISESLNSEIRIFRM